MLKIFYYVFLFTSLINITLAQDIEQRNKISGKISYISLQSIYVKFDNTDGIIAGDTLFTENTKAELKPAAIVKFVSTTSIAGTPLDSLKFTVSQVLIAFARPVKPEEITVRDTSLKTPTDDSLFTRRKEQVRSGKKSYEARISVQSMSDFGNSGSRYDSQRWRYNVLFNTEKIDGGNFSVYSYFTFQYKASEWGAIDFGQRLKVYDLAVLYKIDSTSSVYGGRHLNPRVSNIGTIDGFQYEKKEGVYYYGAVIGSRPNNEDYGFNAKLMQFGAYINRTDNFSETFDMDNSLAIFQQTYNFNTDRRFLYFQHSSNPFSNAGIFFSTEVDLYKQDKAGTGQMDFNLTSLYLSARYSPMREISINASYDARKNVMYYETYKTLLESALQNELQQGVRLSTNVRATNYLNIGARWGYRYMKTDAKPSNNYGGYATYSSMPYIDGTLTASADKTSSSYVSGFNFGLNYYREILPSLSGTLGINRYGYDLPQLSTPINQTVVSLDLSYLLTQNFYCSINYEGVFEQITTYGRVFVDFTARF